MTGLSPREASAMTLAEVIAWSETIKAENARARLAARRRGAR